MFGPGKLFSPTTITRILKKMMKIRGLIIPDEDKKYVSELSKVNPFTYKNIDFRDRIPLTRLFYSLFKNDAIYNIYFTELIH